MNKKICDSCKKTIGDGYITIHLTKIEKFLFRTLDICEKCFNSVPKLLKDAVSSKSQEKHGVTSAV